MNLCLFPIGHYFPLLHLLDGPLFDSLHQSDSRRGMESVSSPFIISNGSSLPSVFLFCFVFSEKQKVNIKHKTNYFST